jgi:hypothetical protein
MRRLRDAGELTADQMRCFVRPRPSEELYDLKNDPFELQNLAGVTKFKKVLEQMREALVEWETLTKDSVPKERRDDEFDRETGDRLKRKRNAGKKKKKAAK